MEIIQDKAFRGKRKKIVNYIFNGLTITQMAMELGITRSCICYHIKRIYKKYEANNRSEFLLAISSQMIEKYKDTIQVKSNEFESLKKEHDEIKTILSGLLFSKNNPENFTCWELKAKKFF